MRSIKHKKQLKRNLIISAIVIFIILVTFMALELFNITHFFINTDQQKNITTTSQTINYNQPTVEQKQSGDSIKKSNQDNNTKQNQDGNLSISITTKNTTESLVQIRSIINGTISNNGVCTLTMSQGNKIVTKTANTYALPSDSTCRGFDINRDELSIGNWNINLSVSVNQQTTNITDTMTLE